MEYFCTVTTTFDFLSLLKFVWLSVVMVYWSKYVMFIWCVNKGIYVSITTSTRCVALHAHISVCGCFIVLSQSCPLWLINEDQYIKLYGLFYIALRYILYLC